MSLINQRFLNQSLKCNILNIIKYQNSVKEQIRFVHRAVNIKKPISHWRRDLVKAVTKPKYEKRYNVLPIDELCTNALIHKKKLETQNDVHPYHQILGKEFYEKLNEANVVVILHSSPYVYDDFHDMCLDFHEAQMTYLHYEKKAIKPALEKTIYESLLKLYEIKSLTFTSQAKDVNFAKLLKIIKKHNFVTLIGGVYEKRIISITDFQMLATNPFIGGYQSQLSSLLASSGQKLSGNLSRHQQELCSSLQRYIDDQTKVKPSEE